MTEPDAPPAPADTPAHAEGYRVLARRYRPQRLSDLVGQEAMVRALRAAFETGRIAQAFILTGIRGTGKTTTARLIAKGLNCVGPDGRGGPTTEPCGVCGPCVAIAEGRHVDVLELDAASRTGVGDMREIIESVAYRAASARHKVHIIDEVHMLSTSAFNALLKTLEEPPPHVVFILATTEIRRVPLTVLSRCQRFDLRRIEPEAMAGLLRRIAQAEGARIEPEAMALLVRAAEGSARDATSLLDQAIAVAGGGAIEAGEVRAMLGLADRARVMDLFEMILRGRAAEALAELRAQHAAGADALMVLRDLAEAAHWLSVLKIAPEAAEDPLVAPQARERGRALAHAAPMRALSRLWQMLLAAIEEAARAPSALMAAEMAVIRLTHVADLPSPEELVRRLQEAAPHETAARAPLADATRPDAGGGAPGAGRPAPGAAAGEAGNGPAPAAAPRPAPEAAPGRLTAAPRPPEPPVAASLSRSAPAAERDPSRPPALPAGAAARPAATEGEASGSGSGEAPRGPAVVARPRAADGARTAREGDAAPASRGEGRLRGAAGPSGGATAMAARRAPPPPAHAPAAPAEPGPLAALARFEDVVALIRARRDLSLLIEVERGLRLVRYAPGRIEFTPAEGAAPDLAQRLSAGLGRWTGARWGVSVVSGGAAPTVSEAREAARRAQEAQAMAHPLVQAVLARFPAARIVAIRKPPDPSMTDPSMTDPSAPGEDAPPDPEAEGSWDSLEDG